MTPPPMRYLLPKLITVRFFGAIILTALNLPIAILLVPSSIVYWAVIYVGQRFFRALDSNLGYVLVLFILLLLSSGIAVWIVCGVNGNIGPDGALQAWQLKTPSNKDIIFILVFAVCDMFLVRLSLQLAGRTTN